LVAALIPLTQLLIASHNAGKVREFRQLLAPLNIAVQSQAELGIPAAAEPFFTFAENALAKARHASHLSGLPTLADDSGICVSALDNRPGVHSARYAATENEPANDERNNTKLLTELKNQTNRAAHYVCALVLVRSADDPTPLVVECRWDGEIINQPRGSNGFGYDPYFYLPSLGKTVAELSPAEKNRLSHRGQALQQLLANLA
jgi:XTP/dITP diphosphohydrolase